MIYTIDTVPEDTTVYGFAYKFFNHDNQFDGSEPDSTPAYIFKYADTIQEATVAYNDLVCDRMEWLGDLLKKSSDDLYLEF